MNKSETHLAHPFDTETACGLDIKTITSTRSVDTWCFADERHRCHACSAAHRFITREVDLAKPLPAAPRHKPEEDNMLAECGYGNRPALDAVPDAPRRFCS